MKKEDDMEHQFVRTMSVVKALFGGARITLKDGFEIAMSENLQIGFLFKSSDGSEGISPMGTMDLSQLNSLLEKHGIGMVIPSRRRR